MNCDYAIQKLLEKELIGTKIKMVDLFHRGKLIYARDHNLYAKDFFHPSTRGYEIWTRLFNEQLAAKD